MVANSNSTSFGWYCGEGQNTIQYYHYGVPGSMFEAFQEWQTNGPKDVSPWYVQKFEKHGFSFKLFYKDYIYGNGIVDQGSRVVKLTDPESIFTNQEDLDRYRKSKEALIYIKFPVK